MEKKLKRFNDLYKVLYDADFTSSFILCNVFDELMKDEDFAEEVRKFVMFRGDVLSSDREVAAYLLMIGEYNEE